MKITSTLSALLLAGGVLAGAPFVAQAQNAKPPAKLTMTQARDIALKTAPGKIVDSEYENESGGWRYSFDIRQGKLVHEIGVDANSGKIVEDKFEGTKDKD